jgi:DNA-binding NtrC family response regulator
MKNTKPVVIYVVEDDLAYSRFLKYVLELNPDFETSFFTSGKEFLKQLAVQKPSVVTLDYSLPDMTGEEVLKSIQSIDPSVPVIIVSAQEKIETAVKLLKAGAYDYVSKDADAKDRILHSIQNAASLSHLSREVDLLRQEVGKKYTFEKSIIGSSAAIRHVFDLMEKASRSNITISITGETGTGKELVAKAIHYNSVRKEEALVTVNTAAIPKDLIESELFGHEKGAFTGAISRRIGKFEEADGGTLFLDEIGELDINLQAKILRVLQEKEITRVGSNQVIKTDTRLIVATHRDLTKEVKAGKFREDLYYRLLGLPIHLPPLRDRGEDILLLARHFADQYVQENQLDSLKLTTSAHEKLLSYSYPGNIRELKSIMDLAAVMCDNGVITDSHITFQGSTAGSSDLLSTEMSLQKYTYIIIRRYLNKYNNNVLEVAKILGIGKSSIYRYLKEMENEGM